MTWAQYNETWHDTERLRAFVEEWARMAPELFPTGFDPGYRLHGFGRESRKLPGVRLMTWRIPCSWPRMACPRGS